MKPIRNSLAISFFLLGLFPLRLTAMEIGNPAQPVLQKKGVVIEDPKKWSFRLAYLDDYVYRMRFKDAYLLSSLEPSSVPTFAKLSTTAGLITLNFANRIDFYSILGSAQIQIDKEIYTKRDFAWGVGGKILFAKVAKVHFGFDLKYFCTNQSPVFFVSEGFAYNILNDFKLRYTEIQGSLGATYKTKYIAPYLQLTYLISELTPNFITALVQYPLESTISLDANSKPVIGQRHWGMAVGATLLGSPKATLTVESRFINQNAIDVTGEIRF